MGHKSHGRGARSSQSSKKRKELAKVRNAKEEYVECLDLDADTNCTEPKRKGKRPNTIHLTSITDSIQTLW